MLLPFFVVGCTEQMKNKLSKHFVPFKEQHFCIVFVFLILQVGLQAAGHCCCFWDVDVCVRVCVCVCLFLKIVCCVSNLIFIHSFSAVQCHRRNEFFFPVDVFNGVCFYNFPFAIL